MDDEYDGWRSVIVVKGRGFQLLSRINRQRPRNVDDINTVEGRMDGYWGE